MTGRPTLMKRLNNNCGARTMSKRHLARACRRTEHQVRDLDRGTFYVLEWIATVIVGLCTGWLIGDYVIIPLLKLTGV